MTAPLLRYGWWQLRDHLRGAGLVIAAGAALVAVVLWRMKVANPAGFTDAAQLLPILMGQLGWPLVLVVTSGMVSTDRVDGYYRALFSAPVSPLAFYLQRYLLGAAVVATLPVALATAILVATGDWAPPGAATAVLLLLYLLLGGLVFFWSTVGRRDWAIALSVFAVHGALTSAMQAGASLPRWLELLHRALPPFHLVNFGGFAGGVARPPLLPAGTGWLHFAGWGIGLVAAGLLVLRFRPLGSGGRG